MIASKIIRIVIIILCVVFIINDNKAQDLLSRADSINLASQIPENKLSILTTEELVHEYFNSRYPVYFFIYDDIKLALEKQYRDYNGLRELLKRKDAGKEILKYYKKMDPDDLDLKWELAKQGHFSFSFLHAEILLGHELVLNNLNTLDAKKVLTELLIKYDAKKRHPQVYSNIGIQSIMYSMVQVLDSKGDNIISKGVKALPDYQYLKTNGNSIHLQAYSDIKKLALEFINKNN